MDRPKVLSNRSVADAVRSTTIGRKILWLVSLGFVLRVCARLYTGEEDFWVNGYTFYFDLAQNIAAGKGMRFTDAPPTTFRVPLYPAFLAMLTWGHQLFVPVLLAQGLIGAGTVWCAALLTGEMFGVAAAIIAAVVAAIYPYYVVHDTALQETSLFTLLTAVALILLRRARRSESRVTALCAGLALGVDVLTRATIAPFAALAPIWLMWAGGRARLRTGLLCASMLGIVVSPWLVRSWKLTGAPALATETGMELWRGNNPLTFSHYPRESIDLSEASALRALTPAEQGEIGKARDIEAAGDEWFWRKGMSYIHTHPWLTIGNSFRKIGAAFGWLPSPRRGLWRDLVHLLSYGPVMLLGLGGMWAFRQRWREHMIFYVLFATFAGVTAVFYGHTSHRTYLDVYWIVFAAGLLSRYLPASRARSGA
jgi:4-amino-4-deoxy-L-arabinose transferase-like glycosyltransferase